MLRQINMKNPEDSKEEETLRVIVDILAEKKYSEKARLAIVRGFKRKLNKGVPTLESKFVSGCDVESMIDALSLADSPESSCEFQTEYFTFLLNAIWNLDIHEKIILELVRVLKSRKISKSLVLDLWNVLERHYLVWPEVIQEVIPSSKFFIEEKIFNWITQFIELDFSLDDLNVRYYAEVSVHCCDIFSMFTTCFDEFVIILDGNEKVLQLVHYFTSYVSQIADKAGKAIFKLYPRKFSHIITFLSIPPRIFLNNSKSSKDVYYETQVLKILFHSFKNDQKNTLLLLTHYPEWLAKFSAYVEHIIQ